MYNALTFYHGANEMHSRKPSSPFYCAPNTKYKLLYERNNLHSFNLNPESPYHTDNISLIESLTQFPEKMELMKNMGFDCVIYSKPGNPLLGHSGWGNDASQYLVLDPSIVTNWRPIPTPTKLPEQTVNEIPVLGRFQHSASAYFSRFSESADIGYHFGSAKAAKARMRAMNNQPDVKVDTFSPSATDLQRLATSLSPQSNERDMLIALLFRKLESPHSNLIDIVNQMPADEIMETFNEYKRRPDIPDYEARLKAAQRGIRHTVTVDGHCRHETESKEEALAYAEAYRQSYTKTADILMSNPLFIDDLGTWSHFDILKSVGADKEQISHLYNIEEHADRSAFVISVVESKGYDGITYRNQVEDPGSLSCIAFHNHQIHYIQPRLPFLPNDEEKNKIQSIRDLDDTRLSLKI